MHCQLFGAGDEQWYKTWFDVNGGWCETWFQSYLLLSQQQIRAVAVEAPRETRSEPPLGRAFVDSRPTLRNARKPNDPHRGDPLRDGAVPGGVELNYINY